MLYNIIIYFKSNCIHAPSFSVQLPNNSISCEPPYLEVEYNSSSGGNSSTISFDIDNCTSTSPSSSLNPSYKCRVSDEGSCQEDYHVQVAYKNDIDNKSMVSNYSDAWHLQGPSQGVCVQGFPYRVVE